MHVVGDHALRADFRRDLAKARQHLNLLRDAVVLQLDIEILAEHALQTICMTKREVVIVL